MSHITLTDEQVRALEGTQQTVEVRTPDGRVLGVVRLLDPLDLEALRRHQERGTSPHPTIPSARVGALLQKATEIDQREGMTPEKMRELVRKVVAGEAL